MCSETRADILLVEKGLATSRTQAQRMIGQQRVHFLAGAQWQLLRKPGLKLVTTTAFNVTADQDDRFVSRGGLKLAAALEKSRLRIEGLTALDVGQSTGGFTDCLLQAGAGRVVGVDVGRDQLAPRLRDHPRVVCLEGINARELPEQRMLAYTDGRGFDLAVMDVSFISQTLIVPALAPLIKPLGYLISLVKPQFEVGRAGIGKGGLVRDPDSYSKVEEKIRRCFESCQFVVRDYGDSPIRGGDGNREFLITAVKRPYES